MCVIGERKGNTMPSNFGKEGNPMIRKIRRIERRERRGKRGNIDSNEDHN